jgi:hypothetical protein
VSESGGRETTWFGFDSDSFSTGLRGEYEATDRAGRSHSCPLWDRRLFGLKAAALLPQRMYYHGVTRISNGEPFAAGGYCGIEGNG